MTLKSGEKFEEKLIFGFKMTRIWLILIQAIKSLKNLHFDLKKNIGVIFYDTEESCKI